MSKFSVIFIVFLFGAISVLCFYQLTNRSFRFVNSVNSIDSEISSATNYFSEFNNDSDFTKTQKKDTITSIPHFFKEQSHLNSGVYCLSGHETDIWFMGSNGINWNADTPRVITGFNTSTWTTKAEGYSSICDRNGKLILYTDNQTIFNGAHQIITSIKSKFTSTMTLILPLPGQDSIYYFFYPDAPFSYINDLLPYSLYYAVINIKGNNNKGSVIKKDQNLLNGSSEKITGIRHCNGHDWWVLGLRSEDEAFHAWLLTDTGLIVNNPVISYSGILHNNALFSKFQNAGYLIASHNGSLLAEITNAWDKPGFLELHQFNPSSGIVHDGKQILNNSDNVFCYSAGFSPDNSKLYLPSYNTSIKFELFQFDVSALDSTFIKSSMTQVYFGNVSNIGAPVLGKDHRIYWTTWETYKTLHVIYQPNRKGLACDCRAFDFDLGIESAAGAPLFPAGLQFPNSLYIQGCDLFCADTTVQFILSDPCQHPTTEWSLLDGGQLKNQNGDTIQVYYPNKGNFRIAASYPTPCGQKTDTLKIQVTTCNCYPSISWTRMDTSICEGSKANFQFVSNSTEILLNNNLLTADTFSLSNLKQDTSIQLMIKYPRSCDSIITVNIKVHHPSYSEEQIPLCEGDSVFVGNKWIYDSDTLKRIYSNSLGCDSIHSIFIQKIRKDSLQLQAQICEGDSVLVFGIWRNISGILRENYISSQGCDSVVSYEIKASPLSPKQTNQFRICPGDSILLNGNWYKDSTTVIQQLQNQFGCDSIIENDISVYPKSNSTFEVKLLCPGDSILIQGKYYKDTTTIKQNYKNQSGCDSIHSIQVSFHPNVPITNLKYSFCDGDSTQFENMWIGRDSQILRTFPSSSLCDSIVINQFIKLNKSIPTSEKINLCFDDSALIQNKWYHQDTSIQIHYSNQQTCDSLHIVDLQFYPKPNTSIETFDICKGDSIQINNNWYYDSISIQQKLSNQYGCDSIHKIQISLKPGPQPVELSFYFCKGDSVEIKNTWYHIETSFSERRSSPFSCDTVINYHAISYKDIFVDLGNDLSLSPGEVYTINPTHSDNVITYKWSPVEGLSCADCPSPEIIAIQNKTYFLEVSDQNGCTALDSITIRVKESNSDIYIPNVFSPNGDNINDIWMPILSDPLSKVISLSIYDRWGNKVFDCSNKIDNITQCGWNGMFEDKKCLSGVYVYHVNWQDQKGISKIQAGDLTLLR